MPEYAAAERLEDAEVISEVAKARYKAKIKVKTRKRALNSGTRLKVRVMGLLK